MSTAGFAVTVATVRPAPGGFLVARDARRELHAAEITASLNAVSTSVSPRMLLSIHVRTADLVLCALMVPS